MAAYAGQGDIRIGIFHFLDLAAASEQSPDVNITRKENSYQAASGSQAEVYGNKNGPEGPS
jgi:hypothetical protein